MVRILTSIIVLLLSSLSCKSITEHESININNAVDIQKTVTGNENTYSTCEGFINELVRSSNASALKNFGAVQIRISTATAEKLSIELYVSNDISEDPSVKKIADNSVGWLEFFPATKKLQDITNDLEMPEILKYDTTILRKVDFNKLCFSSQSINADEKNTESDVNCYRREETGYSFKYICEYSKNNNLAFLYSQISDKFDQDDLLKNLPLKDTVYTTESTPEIKYVVKKDIISIKIISEGGETNYKIYKIKEKGIIEATKSID